jgi:uncharacterized protein (TIGR03118 family)
MKTPAVTTAKWSGLIALSALGGALAACGGGGYGGSGSTNYPAPTASLSVEPTTITIGQSATLNWSASAGTTCAASGGWDGPQQATGAAEVTPAATGDVTYTLTCSGATFTGNATQTVTLTVQAASAYTATALVGDVVGVGAPTTDGSLVNPWGIARGPTTGIWVANNHSDISTIYDGNGHPSPLAVHLVASAGAVAFEPTGMVFNPTRDFVVNDGNQSAPALFIFAGEGGTIAGWSLDTVVPNTNAITMYTAPDGAVYKGLALANNGGGNFLYATDFVNGKVDVLDASFVKQPSTATSFAFADPNLPTGYSPFGIQAITTAGTTRIYVTYAKHDTAEPDDDAPGDGLGIVDAFDTNGQLLQQLVAEGGKLNAPWGVALAPADFGTLSNALLVGNFGDGKIHGYDPGTGRYLGELGDGAGTPFAKPGLWGIAFGNDAANQPHATLFFAAGINGEVNGLYGRIDLGQTPPALGQAPTLTLIAPQGDLSGTVSLTANAQALVAISRVQFYVNGDTLIGTATSEPFTVQWDTTTVTNGAAALRAVATDGDGNVGSSKILTVTVAN